jgi:dihydroorotase
MTLLLKHATVFRGNSQPPSRSDVLIKNNIIVKIAPNIILPCTSADAYIVMCEGFYLLPGLVDAHVHFREPGQEEKEDIRSGSLSAVAGGYTSVIAEPNTSPPIDTPHRLKKLLKLAKDKSIVHFFSKSAITIGQKGYRLANLEELKKAGAVAFSDDGNPVPYDRLMRDALKLSAKLNIPVTPHCEESNYFIEHHLKKCRLYERTTAYSAEPFFVKRDIELSRYTEGHLHISHVSMAETANLIRAAKKHGINVTAEVTPHHLILTSDDAHKLGPVAKVNPPLRTARDISELKQAVVDGTIDIIASDHAPHTPLEKQQSWEQAPFGVIGLETTFALVMTYLVHPGIISMTRAVDMLSSIPARIFRLDKYGIGSLKENGRADLTIVDPERKWIVDANKFMSKARNSPFQGWELRGKVVATIVNGIVVFTDGSIRDLPIAPQLH